MSGGGDVVHANPYMVLEQEISTFMHMLACKVKVLTKGVKLKWYHGMCKGHLLCIRNIYYENFI